MEKEVTNCQECPFVNDDNEYGKTYCQLNDDIVMPGCFQQMPKDKVHDDCPLKKSSVTVKLYKEKKPRCKHEYIMSADSFEAPYCKHCLKGV